MPEPTKRVDVKNVALTPIDLPSGRLLLPGATARVDPDDPSVAAHLTGGGLIPLARPKPTRTRKETSA